MAWRKAVKGKVKARDGSSLDGGRSRNTNAEHTRAVPRSHRDQNLGVESKEVVGRKEKTQLQPVKVEKKVSDRRRTRTRPTYPPYAQIQSKNSLHLHPVAVQDQGWRAPVRD